jgi:hypothetical protein
MANSTPNVCSDTTSPKTRSSSQPLKSISAAAPANSDCLIHLLNSTASERTFEFLETFIQNQAVTNAARQPEGDRDSPPAIEWELVTEAIGGAHSVEQAIGRVVVIVDQINRGARLNRDVLDDQGQCLASPPVRDDDPFFAFSVIDSLPDFGDQSRYRTRLAKKVGRMLRPNEELETADAS